MGCLERRRGSQKKKTTEILLPSWLPPSRTQVGDSMGSRLCDWRVNQDPSCPAAGFFRGKADKYFVAQMDAAGKATVYGCYVRQGYSAIISWQDGTTQVRVVPWMN